MAVVPDGLERVTANETEATQLEAMGAVADMGPDNIAHDVGFASASGAGAMTAQMFELKIALATIVPDQGQLVTDDFGTCHRD